MKNCKDYWPAVKLGSDGINLVHEDEMKSICSWLIALAEMTTGGHLKKLYPGYFYKTHTQVDREDIYSYFIKFFPMYTVERGDAIKDSEEQFRINIVAVGDDFHLAVLASSDLLFRGFVLAELSSERCFNAE